jgi:hypothetical protein
VKAHHAIAIRISHVTGTPDVTATFATGGAAQAALPTATYYPWLCPLTNCYLRQLAAVLQTSIIARIGGTGVSTVTAAITDGGIVSFTFTGDVPTGFTFVAPMWQILGFNSATPTITGGVLTGVVPMWHLILLVAATGNAWQPMQAGGTEATTAGKVYAYAATNTSYRRTLKVVFQPTDPVFKASASSEATPMYPNNAYLSVLGSISGNRDPSVLDNLYLTRGSVPCNVAIGNWLTVKASTTEGFWQAVYVVNSLSLKVERHNPAWAAYEKFDLDLIFAGVQNFRA